MATHELTILSYHLKNNLWLDNEFDMYHLGDDICIDLDISMMVRREGVEGPKSPEGILTKFDNTPVGNLLVQISHQEDPGTINLGFLLLTLGEETIDQLNHGIEEITKLSRQDRKCHDLTISIDGTSTGLTIHSNIDLIEIAGPKLKRHAERRKYSVKADGWFAICIDPYDKNLKFGVELNYKWEQSDEMGQIIEYLPKPQRNINFGTKIKGKKIGRNEPCPCGSGKKFKKCCIDSKIS